MKTVLYTAQYGRYDTVKPVPLDLGVPAFLFTDDPDTAEQAGNVGWMPLVVPHGIVTLKGDPRITAPMLAHKWWKTHPPTADVSIWIDGSMTVCLPGFVDKCLGALGEDDWAIMPHPERTCIYPEADLSEALSYRYDPPSIRAQANHYAQFHPPGWGLFATGFMVRRHTPEVLEVCEQWWDECLAWSHQDQLSLPVLFRLHEGLRFNANLPWGQWLQHHEHGG